MNTIFIYVGVGIDELYESIRRIPHSSLRKSMQDKLGCIIVDAEAEKSNEIIRLALDFKGTKKVNIFPTTMPQKNTIRKKRAVSKTAYVKQQIQDFEAIYGPVMDMRQLYEYPRLTIAQKILLVTINECILNTKWWYESRRWLVQLLNNFKFNTSDQIILDSFEEILAVDYRNVRYANILRAVHKSHPRFTEKYISDRLQISFKNWMKAHNPELLEYFPDISIKDLFVVVSLENKMRRKREFCFV